MTETMTHGEYQSQVSSVWRVTVILAIVTIVEVAGALLYPHSMPRMVLNLFFIIMSLIKAFYIVAVFMHMRYERRAMQLTVLLPTIFLVWAIIAFLWEGNAWLEYRSIWF